MSIRNVLAFVAFAGACALSTQALGKETRLKAFESQVEDLRARLRIPGLSVAVVEDQKVLWAKGFGYADYENRIPATPDTVYHIASETKPFAATLVMQLVEQGKLDLDEPISHYSSDFKDDSVRIKHLLSHTTDGPTPGDHYKYDGARYEYLTPVIEKGFGKPFRQVMVETFLDPLEMSSSVPGPDVVAQEDKLVAVLGQDHLDRYAKLFEKLAQPYTLYGDSEIVHVPYPPSVFSASAGLLSTVLDMAKFDAAIDRHVFLKKETQEKAWTNFVSNDGQRLPYGLGWFVADYRGTRLIWHYGNWGTGFSAIYVKAPEKNLSLIMLSNSEALSSHMYSVGGEDITNNAFACAFLRALVSAGAQGEDCESNSQTALTRFLEDRQKNARVAVQLDPKIIDAYVGQYQIEESPRILTVARDGNRLVVDIPKDDETELFAASESMFFIKIRPLEMTFVKDQERVTHIDVVDYGEKWRANKIK
jgi:CubicO group peptidase (beta-lactamase class C family)